MARKSKKQIREETFDRAKKNFDKVFSAEQDQRQIAKEDVSFAQTEDGQWEDSQDRNSPDRPRFTVNKIANALDIVQGNFLEVMPQIKVRPAGNGAKKKDADVRNGLIRNIEAQSNASDAYSNAHWEVINGGRGGWRVKTHFSDDDVFEQDIVIERICDATSSLWLDPNANELDKRDAMYGFFIKQMGIDEYKEMYPKTTMASFDEQLELQKHCDTNWLGGDTVNVAQYYEKVPIKREIAQLTNGKVVDLTEIEPVMDELASQGIMLVTNPDGSPRTRVVDSHKVVMYRMNGMEIIDGPYDFPSKYIPLVEVLGVTTRLEGQTYNRGLVRNSKDSQRIYNYALSHFIETTAITAEQPILATAEQLDGYENEWQRAPVDNPPVLRYNQQEGVSPPQRMPAAQVSPALASQMQKSEADIANGLNVFVAPNRVEGDISGKAIGKMEQNSNMGVAAINRNMSCGIKYTGDIINDMIPKVFDTERTIRVVGEDGSSEEVTINTWVTDEQTGQKFPVYDMSLGKYAIETDIGPSYSTKRVEMFETLQAITQNNTQFSQLYGDLLVKMMDAPAEITDEMTRRARKIMIQQGIVSPTDEEQEEMAEEIAADQANKQAVAKAQKQMLASIKQSQDIENVDKGLSAEKKAAEIDKLAIDKQKTLVDNFNSMMKTFMDMQEKGMPVSEDMIRTGMANIQILNEEQADSLEEQQAIQSQQTAKAAATPSQSAQMGAQDIATLQPMIEQMVAEGRNSGVRDQDIAAALAEQGIPLEVSNQFLGR